MRSGKSQHPWQMEAYCRAARVSEAADFLPTLPENGLFFMIECDVKEQIGLMAVDQAQINAIDDVLTGELEAKAAKHDARPPR